MFFPHIFGDNKLLDIFKIDSRAIFRVTPSLNLMEITTQILSPSIAYFENIAVPKYKKIIQEVLQRKSEAFSMKARRGARRRWSYASVSFSDQ